MKPPDESLRKHVAQWLQKADDDRQLARHLLDEQSPFYAAIAFHAQQAAEKYLKGYLVARGVFFPKTHHVGFLLDLVNDVDPNLRSTLENTRVLTLLAVIYRYPADLPELSLAQTQQAVSLAELTHSEVTAALRVLGFAV